MARSSGVVDQAILPGSRRGTPLALPRHARLGLRLSYGVAHLLAWAWYLRPLGRVAPRVVERMARHWWWPLRALVQAWKLVVIVEAD